MSAGAGAGAARASQYRGVTWHQATGKWMVKIKARFGKVQLVGRFDDEVKAASAYDIAARELHGAKALTNFSLKEATENVGESFKVKEKPAPDPAAVAAANAAKAAAAAASGPPASYRRSTNVAERPNRKAKGPNRLARAWAGGGEGERREEEEEHFDLEAFPVLRLDQIPRMPRDLLQQSMDQLQPMLDTMSETEEAELRAFTLKQLDAMRRVLGRGK